MKKGHPLEYIEKNYHTVEETKEYYKLLIIEAKKIGDEKAAFYYTSLLYLLDNMGEERKKFISKDLTKRY